MRSMLKCLSHLAIIAIPLAICTPAYAQQSIPATQPQTGSTTDKEQWKEERAERQEFREERENIRTEHERLESEHDTLKMQSWRDAKGCRTGNQQKQEKKQALHQRQGIKLYERTGKHFMRQWKLRTI